MWPFSKKAKPSAHVWGPIDRLFADYILHVIGHLSAEKEAMAASIAPKLKSALKTTATEWRAIIAESLHLSDTIDYAILDLWYTNSDKARAERTKLEPDAFATMFVEEYAKEGSQIDVWPGDALAQAKARIAIRRA